MRNTESLDVMAGLIAIAGISLSTFKLQPVASNQKQLELMGGSWRWPKRRWVVQTESNVRRERRKRPDRPCTVCKGSGRVTCNPCQGRGRTNFVELAMLPKGIWPQWCQDCRGSGLAFCARCLGSGERRGVIGFHVFEEIIDVSQNISQPGNSNFVEKDMVSKTR